MGKQSQAKKRLSPRGYAYVQKKHGVEEYRLKKNGLRVLYKHDTTAPVVGVMVTYLVGSRYEVPGNTGATHILEHLMFKGSKKFPPRKGTSALEELSKKGAKVNASTWCDRTNYYEVFPREHLEFVFELEADRMRNAVLTKALLDEELPAVLSEYALCNNEPLMHIDERIWAAAFIAHGYHHSTIGHLSDIEQVTVSRLREFYDTYYHPNNAVVSVVGDVERSEALKLIAKYFGVHPYDSRAETQPHTIEPSQRGVRHIETNRSGEENIVGVAFKIPHARHADIPALTVLNQLLAKSDTSRLENALVETGKATELWSEYHPFYDESLMTMFASVSQGLTHEQLKDEILTVCTEVKEQGVRKVELDRVIAQVRTSMTQSHDGHFALLSVLNEGIAVGDWAFYFDIPKKLETVTVQDIQRVANSYLDEERMTTGFYRAKK